MFGPLTLQESADRITAAALASSARLAPQLASALVAWGVLFSAATVHGGSPETFSVKLKVPVSVTFSVNSTSPPVTSTARSARVS